MLKGFKDFVFRGNVVDLAVGSDGLPGQGRDGRVGLLLQREVLGVEPHGPAPGPPFRARGFARPRPPLRCPTGRLPVPGREAAISISPSAAARPTPGATRRTGAMRWWPRRTSRCG